MASTRDSRVRGSERVCGRYSEAPTRLVLELDDVRLDACRQTPERLRRAGLIRTCTCDIGAYERAPDNIFKSGFDVPTS